MNVAELAIQNAQKHHRLRVQHAKAKVDSSAPLLHVGNFARFTKMREDVETIIMRHRQNVRLLAALNKIHCTKGSIDTFRTEDNSVTPNYSKLYDKLRWLEKIDLENMAIGKMILSAKPKLDSWLSSQFLRRNFKKKSKSFQYPALIMAKYSQLEIPRNPIQLQTLLRPKIWLNIEVLGVRPLGRIVFELYTEAAPQVVMEFVRACHAKQNERIHFIRLYPNLWLEANVLLDEKTLMATNIEYDKRCVDHGQSAGILSFNVKNVFCSAKSILNFSISFKPLNACNGHRVGFGRVSHGLKVLESVKEFGNKNGVLYKKIVATSCGILK